MDESQLPTDNGDQDRSYPYTPQNSTASMMENAEAPLEEAAFVDMKDAVEVQVNDDDVPMEEDDDEEEQVQSFRNVEDMSKAKLQSHTGPVYSVAAHYDASTQSLSILSGGGDDKSFLHRIVSGNSPSTMPLSHAHSDTVSCAAFNTDFVSDDLTKTPKLAAVGGYDGVIVLYDPDTGNKIKELEGPSDVEWLCFHPKGGSVCVIKRLVLLVGLSLMNLVYPLVFVHSSIRYYWLVLFQMVQFGCIIFQHQNVCRCL